MAKVGFSSSYNDGKNKFHVKLTLYYWIENNIHYVFSPALDMVGYGKTESQAKESFEYSFKEFMKYTQNKKTIFDELEHLGWTVNRKKKRIHAPDTEQLLQDSEDYRHLVSKEGVRTENRNIELTLA